MMTIGAFNRQIYMIMGALLDLMAKIDGSNKATINMEVVYTGKITDLRHSRIEIL